MSQIVVVVLGSTLLSAFLWGHNVAGACWGAVDDHEIVEALGPDGTVRPAEFGPLLLVTEVGSPGNSVRYRPSYYALRFGEMLFWGDHPARWYAARVVLFAASLAVLWWLLARSGGLLLGGAIALYAGTALYWSDIWARIGPSEMYAVVGVAMTALGAGWVSAPEWSKRRRQSWIWLSAGLIVALGSKENLIPLLLPISWLVAREWRRGRLTRAGATLFGIAALYGVGIQVAVALALWRSGADVYGRSVALPDRLASTLSGLREHWPVVAISAACVIAGLGVQTAQASASSALRARDTKALRDLALVESFLLLGVVSQLYFYGGARPDPRYAFPLDLLELGVYVAPLLVLLRWIPSGSKIGMLVAASSALIFGSLALARKPDDLIAAGRGHKVSACRFSAAIDRAVATALRDPHSPILIWSDRVDDFEEIFAIRRFLRARGVDSPIVLSTPEPYPSVHFQAELVQALSGMISEVKTGEGWGFSPPSILQGAASCVALGIHERPPPSRCESIGTTHGPSG